MPAFEHIQGGRPAQQPGLVQTGCALLPRLLHRRGRGGALFLQPRLRPCLREQALERDKSHPRPWVNLGKVYHAQATWALEHGKDPGPALDKAEEAVRHARRTGGAPRPLLQRGLKLAEALLTARAERPEARVLRASLLSALAEDTADAREQRALRDRAREEIEAALARNPHPAPVWAERLSLMR